MKHFKENETKAALQLMEQFREKATEKRELAQSAIENPTENSQEWIPISWLMEADFLEEAAEKLRGQIETQSFNL